MLRRVWTEALVTFTGRWQHAGPGPHRAAARCPIPVCTGGGTGTATLRRIARLADAWMPMARASTDIDGLTARMRGYLRDEGRDLSSLGIQATVGGPGPASEWTAAARRWERAGRRT